jgi:hypothetical protein
VVSEVISMFKMEMVIYFHYILLSETVTLIELLLTLLDYCSSSVCESSLVILLIYVGGEEGTIDEACEKV